MPGVGAGRPFPLRCAHLSFTFLRAIDPRSRCPAPGLVGGGFCLCGRAVSLEPCRCRGSPDTRTICGLLRLPELTGRGVPREPVGIRRAQGPSPTTPAPGIQERPDRRTAGENVLIWPIEAKDGGGRKPGRGDKGQDMGAYSWAAGQGDRGNSDWTV